MVHTDINDLHEVLTGVVDVNEKWIELGLALGLKQSTLKKIKTDNRTSSGACKREMMEEWLNRTDECTPSWAELIKALKARTVGHTRIADEIEKNKLMQ